MIAEATVRGRRRLGHPGRDGLDIEEDRALQPARRCRTSDSVSPLTEDPPRTFGQAGRTIGQARAAIRIFGQDIRKPGHSSRQQIAHKSVQRSRSGRADDQRSRPHTNIERTSHAEQHYLRSGRWRRRHQPQWPGAPAFSQIKARQQATWASGDFAIIGTTLQIVGEELCEALDLRGGQRVLDVAAGNGNAALAAARRWCDVTASRLCARAAGTRPRARRWRIAFRMEIEIADAEALPFADASFDVVTSTFGAMFTPRS